MASGDFSDWALAADVGGTFTDVVLAGPDERVFHAKILTTTEHHEGVATAAETLLAEAGVTGSAVAVVTYATTAATNAVLQRKGPVTALLTTKGFRDILELRRMRFPDMYNLMWEKPVPIVRRRLRFEVDERIGGDGSIVTPLDRGDLHGVLQHLADLRVEAVAVCFLNSYANDEHERLVQEVIRDDFPQLTASLSADLLPEAGEYERTSTTVVNAFLIPVVGNHMDRLRGSFRALGIECPVLVMQSNGGMTSIELASRNPVQIVESGPAAGVVGGRHLAEAVGVKKLITFDMGGTTAKASLIEDGEFLRAAELEIGAPISVASRVFKGGGYVIRVPAIDLAEVGAGGGSIAYVDLAGGLHVGPESAGASPGPACYNRGGTQPTVTDANVVLGYLNPDALVGGSLPIDSSKAEAALRKLGDAVDLPLLDTAIGVYRIAVATMVRSIRGVSTERGRDVRDGTLLAFGGNGAVFAAEIAKSLGMSSCLIPQRAGVFSAIGLLSSEIELHYVKAANIALDREVLVPLAAVTRELIGRARQELEAERWGERPISWQHAFDLHYRGQSHEFRLSAPSDDGLNADLIERLRDQYHEEHERTYGYRQGGTAIQIRNVRLIARVDASHPRLTPVKPKSVAGTSVTRSVYFGPEVGPLAVEVLQGRNQIGTGPRQGPLVVEEYDTTILVPPKWTANLEADSTVKLSFSRQAASG